MGSIPVNEIQAAGGLDKWLSMNAVKKSRNIPDKRYPAMEKSGHFKRHLPGQKAADRKPTEHEEQVALMKLCKKRLGKYPELALFFAIPNGGHRNKIVATKLKAEGVKAGIPDLMLPVARGRYHGLFIEMKKVEGSKTQESQKAMIKALQKQGYMAEICKGADAAWLVIERYLKLKAVGL